MLLSQVQNVSISILFSALDVCIVSDKETIVYKTKYFKYKLRYFDQSVKKLEAISCQQMRSLNIQKKNQ